MRPYSHYLDAFINETFAPDFNLAGSTPPIPARLSKASVKVPLDTKTYTKKLEALTARLTEMTGAISDNILFTPGSTQACFQSLAAVTNPGDTVILESPVYEPYVATAKFLGLNVVRFARTADLSADLAEIAKVAPKAKAVVISNPHCPTGRMYDPQEIGKLAKLNMFVILDEVFLPLFGGGLTHRTQIPGELDNVILISGLSKSTGLGLMRIGWTISSAEVAKRIQRIGLILNIGLPASSVPVAEFAFKNWRVINSQLMKLADGNRALVRDFAKRYPSLVSHDFSRGFFGMIKVPPPFASGADFTKEVLDQGVFIRDGGFFEMPEWVRFHTMVPARDFKKIFAAITGYF